MKTKNNDITITVTLNGSEVYRNFRCDDLENLTGETFGPVIVDMIDSLRKADEPL